MVEGFPFLSLCLSDEEIGCHSDRSKKEKKMLTKKKQKEKKCTPGI